MMHGMLVSQEEFDDVVKDAVLRCDLIVSLDDGTEYRMGFGCENSSPEEFNRKLGGIARTISNALRAR